MSKDTIYRQDAIKALDNAWINGTSLLDANEAIKQLHALPSSDRSQEWIPCSKMSPEENGEYLITLAFAWGREIEVGLWSDGEWLNDNSHVNIAWMPLPKPWKGAADE
jgi:hypothetical protein